MQSTASTQYTQKKTKKQNRSSDLAPDFPNAMQLLFVKYFKSYSPACPVSLSLYKCIHLLDWKTTLALWDKHITMFIDV